MLTFWALLALVFAVCAGVAYLEPIAGDCWTGVDWLPILTSVKAVWGLIKWNYTTCNPRFGETFLYLTGGHPLLHTVLTPSMIVLTVVAVMALATGRLPRPRQLRDSGILLVTVALVCVGLHSIGENFFYRPQATNYLYGFCIQAWLLVPVRVRLASVAGAGAGADVAPGAARWWQVPGMLLLGFVAGMCNEHTGPALLVVYAVAGVALVRRQRGAWPWVLAGLVGFLGGYLTLFFAPGQMVRYAGMGKQSIVARIVKQGVRGLRRPFVGIIVEAWPALLVLASALTYGWWRRRQGRALAMPWMAVAALVGAALLVGATLWASPILGPRLFLAPALLLVTAAIAALLPAFASPRAFAALVGVAALIVGFHAVRFLQVHADLHEDFAARARLLEQAPRGQVTYVRPARHFFLSHWAFGDDMREEAWRRTIGGRYGMPALALDTTDAKILLSTGVITDWVVDGKPLAVGNPATVAPPPTATPLAPAFLARAHTYLEASLPGLQAATPAPRSLCLRLYVPPALGEGKPICVARWQDGRSSAVAEHVREGGEDVFRFPAGAWPFERTFVVSLDGQREPLAAVDQEGARVFRRRADARSSRTPRLLLGCDDAVCVIGSIFGGG